MGGRPARSFTASRRWSWSANSPEGPSRGDQRRDPEERPRADERGLERWADGQRGPLPLRGAGAGAPTRRKARLGAVNAEIQKNDRALTSEVSSDGRTASAVLYRFEALELERQFAEKL